MSQHLVIVGASGHAKVVAEAAQLSGFEIIGFVDQSADCWGTKILGIPVLGDESALKSSKLGDYSIVIAVGDNATRESIAVRLNKLGAPFACVIHPSAVISPSATLGDGTVILAGAVVNSTAVVGNHCIVNTMASVDHDCVIGDFAHISPGAHLAGSCEIGRSALVGIGAIVLPGISIGAGTTVGAGAVVTKDLPSDVVAIGVPAKIVRTKERQE